MRLNISTFLAVALLMASFAVTACNTVEGAGEDIQAGGRSIERAAQ